MPALTSSALGTIPLLAAFRDNALEVLRRADALGDIARVDLLYRATVFVKQPEALCALFDSQDVWARGEGLVPLIGRNVLTTNGEAWAYNRRLAQPSFHFRMTDLSADRFAGEAAPLLDQWARFAASDAPIDIAAEAVRVFARIATRAFGLDLTEHEAEQFPDVMLRLQRWAFRVVAGGHIRTPQASRDITFLEAIVERALATPSPPDQPPTYLERIRQDHDVDRATLRDHLMIVLIAPADNPPNALAFAVWLLAHNPAVEEAVRQEVRSVLGREIPTREALERMPLLERVVWEALRLYPPVWILARHALVDTELLHHRIPAGTIAWTPPYFVHRHPAVWEEPEAFRPDRFLPEAVEKRHRLAFIPFGAGPRMCIGARLATLEMRMALAMFLQRFRARPGFDGQLPLEGSFGLRSRIGIPVKLELAR